MKKKGAMLYEISEEIRAERDTVCDLTGVRPEVLDRLLRQTAEKLVTDFMRGNVLRIYQHAIGQIELPMNQPPSDGRQTPSGYDALDEALDAALDEPTEPRLDDELDRVLGADGDIDGPPVPVAHEPVVRRLPGESRADALKRVLEL